MISVISKPTVNYDINKVFTELNVVSSFFIIPFQIFSIPKCCKHFKKFHILFKVFLYSLPELSNNFRNISTSFYIKNDLMLILYERTLSRVDNVSIT